jgi:hypothetical protein
MTKTSAVPPTRGEELLQRLNIKWGRLKGRTSPDNLKRLGQSAHDSLHDRRLDRQLAKYEM